MEKFKKIHGFKYYYVSSLGNVKTVNWRNTGKAATLKPAKDKKGYLRVSLIKDGKLITCKVHRLVAKAFIPNPKNKPQVNHKDCNKENNCVDNLEWVTPFENVHHAWKNGLMDKAGKKEEVETKRSEFNLARLKNGPLYQKEIAIYARQRVI